MRASLIALVALVALVAPASAQDPAAAQDAGLVHHEGLGSLTFPTSGAPEARTDFERGVLLLHSFEYAAAAAAFRAAQENPAVPIWNLSEQRP